MAHSLAIEHQIELLDPDFEGHRRHRILLIPDQPAEILPTSMQNLSRDTTLLTKHVRNEDAMEFCFFKQFCQVCPVIYIIEPKRLILRMAPKTWRLVPTAFVMH